MQPLNLYLWGHINDYLWGPILREYFIVSEVFGIVFLIFTFLLIGLDLKFPTRDDFMKKAKNWMLVALITRTTFCLI